MCICGYVYLWVCVFVGMCICGYVYLWVCVFVGMCICGYVCLWVCEFVGMCIDPIPSLIAESDIRTCYEEEVCWRRGW